jgi:hypothetical protein
MAPVIECVRCMSACLFYVALMILAIGDAFAKKVGDTGDVRSEDRAAIEACLDIGARVPLDNVASPTGAEVDSAAWMAYRARNPKLAASNCIGVVSTPCLQDPDQYGTTVNMVECLTRAFRVWDERLNAAYKQRMKGCQKRAR